MNKIKPITDQIYHIYNRGVEKRTTFLDDQDYLRFIHDLFEFNDESPAININNLFKKKTANQQSLEGYLPKIDRKPRKFIVEVIAFCLMPNHFHLLVKQVIDGGISKLMLKLGTGYTNYFNEKYQRVGSLFQGTYKLAHLTHDAHFIHLPYYIHLNPLDLISPEWREREIQDFKKAMGFLENYRWSSFLDYIGKKNFPSVTQREFLLQFFNGPAEYKKETSKWLAKMNLAELDTVLLE